MDISEVRATRVHFDDDSFWVSLTDGRVLGVPLAVVSTAFARFGGPEAAGGD